tara:strand:- start:409 stop:648 length:240 start_codon:yes stop_codon:yes gene_type:complete
MKHDTVYNKPDNQVMVRTRGNEIVIICDREDQTDQVVKRMTTDTCKLAGYEEWDDDEDRKWILTFLVVDKDQKIVPHLN